MMFYPRLTTGPKLLPFGLPPPRSGLEDLCLQMREWHDKWSRRMGFGASVGMADLVQVGASVGAVVCPLGPRMRTFVGRRDGAAPGDSARLPDVRAPADDLIRLFRYKTIGPHQLVALVGAHTTSQQRAVDPARAGDPQDSTPGVWDTLFYAETTMPDEDEVGVGDGDDAAGDRNATAPRVFRFASDVALAQHPTTSDEWSAFAENGAQVHWNRVSETHTSAFSSFERASERVVYGRFSIHVVVTDAKRTPETRTSPAPTSGSACWGSTTSTT